MYLLNYNLITPKTNLLLLQMLGVKGLLVYQENANVELPAFIFLINPLYLNSFFRGVQ